MSATASTRRTTRSSTALASSSPAMMTRDEIAALVGSLVSDLKAEYTSRITTIESELSDLKNDNRQLRLRVHDLEHEVDQLSRHVHPDGVWTWVLTQGLEAQGGRCKWTQRSTATDKVVPGPLPAGLATLPAGLLFDIGEFAGAHELYLLPRLCFALLETMAPLLYCKVRDHKAAASFLRAKAYYPSRARSRLHGLFENTDRLILFAKGPDDGLSLDPVLLLPDQPTTLPQISCLSVQFVDPSDTLSYWSPFLAKLDPVRFEFFAKDFGASPLPSVTYVSPSLCDFALGWNKLVTASSYGYGSVLIVADPPGRPGEHPFAIQAGGNDPSRLYSCSVVSETIEGVKVLTTVLTPSYDLETALEECGAKVDNQVSLYFVTAWIDLGAANPGSVLDEDAKDGSAEVTNENAE